jgi:hypothetical protein
VTTSLLIAAPSGGISFDSELDIIIDAGICTSTQQSVLADLARCLSKPFCCVMRGVLILSLPSHTNQRY